MWAAGRSGGLAAAVRCRAFQRAAADGLSTGIAGSQLGRSTEATPTWRALGPRKRMMGRRQPPRLARPANGQTIGRLEKAVRMGFNSLRVG